MLLTLDSLCAELRNYFVTTVHTGTYTIDGGTFLPSELLADGQFFCIRGSTFNDGVWQWPAYDLVDETFTGEIWAMALPPAFLALAEDIASLRARLDELAQSEGAKKGFSSESFEGYSYSVSSDLPPDVQELQNRIRDGKRRWRKI